MITFDVTLTDTFGGEANYSWVKRGEIQVKNDAAIRSISREARRAVGMTNVRASCFVDFGDMIQIEFKKDNLVLFITPKTEAN